uniref:Uncharacterized protein n=1 Tax=Branchiostoma floridae TaxID=7739 RepID=C3Y5Z7_BRAFL|eukprot:XP_002608384.1 hypothetical protein BRAFLDRAFT_95385 [Branchiostoma floridae]
MTMRNVTQKRIWQIGIKRLTAFPCCTKTVSFETWIIWSSLRCTNVRLNIRRTRQPEDTEAGYRKRVRQESVSEDSEGQRIDGAVTLWQERILPMRPAVHDMIEKLMKRGVAAREAQQARQELEAIIEDYQPPQRPAQALGDCLFLEIHRRLFDTNNNED